MRWLRYSSAKETHLNLIMLLASSAKLEDSLRLYQLPESFSEYRVMPLL